ncbi:hypothetical protein [Microbacterium sp. MYb62]|uniref:hypothetical protein n=1 Tax=Microbacterium sp. MYb62 TaxID=1848690 RepID=UPI000CFB50CF|nr:hypothetical protein [Microbacterium sp. MYb62]PRB15237.1 hypothetical protein CQ042_09875 [Microbacterium sp. MYb62]
MHTPDVEPRGPERASRFVPVALTKPVLASALGIDGGAVFQILAVENLGLSPSAIGIAFGLGLLSLPFQLWAARMPLRFARRNVQIFLLLAALQSGLLAWLVAIGATGGLAATALAVTITAEIAISVLYVTAWQPLLSTRVRSRDRQRINAGWNAAGRGLLAGFLIVFSAFEGIGRSLLLAALAFIAIGVAVSFGRVTVPATSTPAPRESPTRQRPPRLPPVLWWILGSFAALHLGALPLWLVYLSAAIWPTADLGAIGAIQTVAVVAALLVWRPTNGGLGSRAMIGVLLVVAGSIALVGVGESAEGVGEHVGVVLVTISMTFGMTYAGLALLEMAHRIVERQQHVVRVFTIIDVVDSSALQLGLFIGGFLVTSSVQTGTSTPYVAFVVAMSILALAAVWRTVRLTAKTAPGDGANER